MPYLAWSENGYLGFPFAAALLVGTYVQELFGRHAGEERDAGNLGFHHAGAHKPGPLSPAAAFHTPSLPILTHRLCIFLTC